MARTSNSNGHVDGAPQAEAAGGVSSNGSVGSSASPFYANAIGPILVQPQGGAPVSAGSQAILLRPSLLRISTNSCVVAVPLHPALSVGLERQKPALLVAGVQVGEFLRCESLVAALPVASAVCARQVRLSD